MISAISGAGSIRGPEATTKSGAAASSGGADFSKVLADVMAGTVDALKTGEANAVAGVNGDRSVQEVVDAVLGAEQALQTAIAIRDKLVAAYQEISRMGI
jgi:flagellar hook-basal body complex protein FliE